MSPQKNKFGAFHASGLSDWEQAAAAELQGADPWKKLTRVVQGLSVKPYYDQHDAPAESLRLHPARETFHGPRTWHNCPRVRVTDAALGNVQALEHLENGAEGILFELIGPVDFNRLLKKIEWAYCSLNFLALDAAPTTAAALGAYLKSFQGPALGAWYGSGGENLPAGRSFRRQGHVLQQTDNPANDIAHFIAKVCDSTSNPFRERTADVAVSLELGTDFFLEITRLRALRQTWRRLLSSRNIPEQDLYVHAISRAWTAEAYAPHGNMIRSTTSAMAAILGGCDALTVDPGNAGDEMETRIARNTAILLREESRFSKVADPLAGAYFIDHLSSEITDQAWSILQPLLAR